jgi:hypothetical protein
MAWKRNSLLLVIAHLNSYPKIEIMTKQLHERDLDCMIQKRSGKGIAGIYTQPTPADIALSGLGMTLV